MASINQLVSEFAHSLGQPNNYALRTNLRSLIVHTRNELIRHSYERHGFIDRNLTQRYIVSLVDTYDGDVNILEDKSYVKRTNTIGEWLLSKNETSIYTWNPNTEINLLGVTYCSFNEYPGIRFEVHGGHKMDINGLFWWDGYTSLLIDNYFNTIVGLNDIKIVYRTAFPFSIKYTITAYSNFGKVIKSGSLGATASKNNNNIFEYIVNINKEYNADNIKYWIISFNYGTSSYVPMHSLEIYSIVHESAPTLSQENNGLKVIKRTLQKVPKPVRLTNNLPFLRVGSVGFNTNKDFPFIKETSARFRQQTPGLCGLPCYDYINGYIYLFPSNNKPINLEKLCIEAAFENPTEIELNNGEVSDDMLQLFDNEWLCSEDMIGQIKDIIYKRDLLNTVRQTDEVPNMIKYN